MCSERRDRLVENGDRNRIALDLPVHVGEEEDDDEDEQMSPWPASNLDYCSAELCC